MGSLIPNAYLLATNVMVRICLLSSLYGFSIQAFGSLLSIFSTVMQNTSSMLFLTSVIDS